MREKQQITYMGIPIRVTADLSVVTLQAKREWQNILIVIKGKIWDQDYSIQKKSHSYLTEKSKALQTSKIKRTQQHQTTFIYNKC